MPSDLQTQFSLFAGEDLKQNGIDRASWSRGYLLDEARSIALEIARTRGEVTYDDVYVEMLKRGLQPENIGNAAGSIFRDPQVFSFTGRWAKSTRISNHARVNRVWTRKHDHA